MADNEGAPMHTGELGKRIPRVGRIAGALLGMHAGDALGATLEFSAWSAVRQQYPDGLREIVGGGPFGWPPGHASDDTDLTRAVLLAYLDADADAGAGSRARDIGGATLRGLERYRRSRDPRAAGRARATRETAL